MLLLNSPLFLKIWIIVSLVLTLLGCSSTATSIREVTSWIELGPHREILARSVVKGSLACPTLQINRHLVPMNVRAAASLQFPVVTCEAPIPLEAETLEIDQVSFPLPIRNPKKILLLGDTGCRITNAEIQDCSNPKDWPFKQIVERAALWKPDLVIHVGDYYYREVPCPPGELSCKGSPSGDSWETWKAEFFTPAKALLTAAPWILVRGNHEDCHRGGEGWFRFLEPRPYSSKCQNFTSPYVVDFDHWQFLVFDSANAEEGSRSASLAQEYAGEVASLPSLSFKRGWLLTHRPPFLNSLLAQAFENRTPTGLELFISGHYHLFEAYNFSGHHPAQLIAGNSGSSLSHPDDTGQKARLLPQKPQLAAGSVKFGYVTLETDDYLTWNVEAHGLDEEILAQCIYQDLKFHCDTQGRQLDSRVKPRIKKPTARPHLKPTG